MERRTFLGSASAAAALVGTAIAVNWRQRPHVVPSADSSAGTPAYAVADSPTPSADAQSASVDRGQSAVDRHQPGVTTAAPQYVGVAAFDFITKSADDRQRVMKLWTADLARIHQGVPPLGDAEPELVSPKTPVEVLLVLGAGFFAPNSLAKARPSWFPDLPTFPRDALQRDFTGGDLFLQVCGDDPLAVDHALRTLEMGVSTLVKRRWTQRGFRQPAAAGTGRNAFGQVDGTIQPDLESSPDAVWRSGGSDWLDGATTFVLRRIGLNMPVWDKVGRAEREEALGRKLVDGAPLTGGKEHDPVDLSATKADGEPVVHKHAHVRLAHSAKPLLRRGYNYVDDRAKPEHQAGLLFISFQADLEEQFIQVQKALDEHDLLNPWTETIGSCHGLVPALPKPGSYFCAELFDA